MKDNNRNATGQAMWYTTPQVMVIEVKARQVLCQSGYGPMREKDSGDGGFHTI